MSKEKALEFIRSISVDKRIDELKVDYPAPVTVADEVKICVSIANKLGYDITEKDIQDAIIDIVTQSYTNPVPQSELSPAELAIISGGVKPSGGGNLKPEDPGFGAEQRKFNLLNIG